LNRRSDATRGWPSVADPPLQEWLPQLIGSQRSGGIIVVVHSTERAAIEAAAANYQPLVV
jgi:hypothetical protein